MSEAAKIADLEHRLERLEAVIRSTEARRQDAREQGMKSDSNRVRVGESLLGR